MNVNRRVNGQISLLLRPFSNAHARAGVPESMARQGAGTRASSVEYRSSERTSQ